MRIPTATVSFEGRQGVGAAAAPLADAGALAVLRQSFRGPAAGSISRPVSLGQYLFPAGPQSLALRCVLLLDFGAPVQVHAFQPLAFWYEAGAAFTCSQTPPGTYTPNLDTLEGVLWNKMGTGVGGMYGVPAGARASLATFEVSHALSESDALTTWASASVPAKNLGSSILNTPPGNSLLTDDDTRRLRFLRVEWTATAPGWRFNCEFPVGSPATPGSTIATYDPLRVKLDFQRFDISYRYRPVLSVDSNRITLGQSVRVGVRSDNGFQAPYTLRVDGVVIPGAVFAASDRQGEVVMVTVPSELLALGTHSITVQESAFSKHYNGSAGNEYPNGADIAADPSAAVRVTVKEAPCCTGVWYDAAPVPTCSEWTKEGC